MIFFYICILIRYSYYSYTSTEILTNTEYKDLGLYVSMYNKLSYAHCFNILFFFFGIIKMISIGSDKFKVLMKTLKKVSIFNISISEKFLK